MLTKISYGKSDLDLIRSWLYIVLIIRAFEVCVLRFVLNSKLLVFAGLLTCLDLIVFVLKGS